MFKKILILFLLYTISAVDVRAEIYKNFTPYQTLKEIKQNYPNAKFEDLKAAWVKEDEYFLSLSGVGISGKIYLKMHTLDGFRKKALENIEKNYPDKDSEDYKTNAKFWLEKLNMPLEERIYLTWVRWIPADKIPFARVEGKYGKPTLCGFDDESFSPYCSWDEKGVMVFQTDDRKEVVFIQYTFTSDELEKALGNPEEPQQQTTKKPNKKKR